MQQTVLNKVRIDRRLALIGYIRCDLTPMVSTMQSQMEQSVRDWRLIFLAGKSLVGNYTLKVPGQKFGVERLMFCVQLAQLRNGQRSPDVAVWLAAGIAQGAGGCSCGRSRGESTG
jgi:hypothetical protein